jgi:uncharacterized protein
MIDSEISKFIKVNNVATLCCTVNDAPWCFNCFYSFVEQEGVLVFKSMPDSKHAAMLLQNEIVSGTILPTVINFAAIKGIQLVGKVSIATNEHHKKAFKTYYHDYPIGKEMGGDIYVVELTALKFTDNTKGFGYKNNWMRQPEL